MSNFIEYFYNIKVDKLTNDGKFYSFIYNGYTYRLYIFDNSIDINDILYTNYNLVGNTLMSEIIYNKDNNIISNFNNTNYILLRIYVNINKKISLEEISYISLMSPQNKKNIQWGLLWSKKIDYLEELINENGKSYPLIVDSFNYFVGLAENAIEYFNLIEFNDEEKITASHKLFKLNSTVDDLYNPLNVIYDYRVRDVAEYIKLSFFNNSYKIFNELYNYLKNNNLSLNEIKLLVARLLYPSFYFDMYDDILIDNKEEKILLDIIVKLDQYEEYLSQIISFLKRYYDIDEINWLKKRRH